MAEKEKSLISIRDWQGLVTHADRQDIPPGAGQIQLNLQSDSPREIRVRRGLTRVQFDPRGLIETLERITVREDVTTFLLFVFRETSDAITITENVAIAFATTMISDSVTVAEALSATQVFTSAIVESVGVSEVYTVRLSMSVTMLSEDIAVTESVSVSRFVSLSVADTVTVSELIAVEFLLSTFSTPWVGSTDDKLYLQSGQFSSTLSSSLSVGAVDTEPTGISWDGTNTPWIGTSGNQLYLTQGQFSSTILDSEILSTINNTPTGVSWDGHNTPWGGNEAFKSKLYLTSGQFTSVIKTSLSVESFPGAPNVNDISFDGTDTPWVATGKLYLQSGQFSSTVKSSRGVSSAATGISWDGTNTLVSNSTSDKLIVQSGKFTSTVKISMNISAIDSNVQGIETNNISGRL